MVAQVGVVVKGSCKGRLSSRFSVMLKPEETCHDRKPWLTYKKVDVGDSRLRMLSVDDNGRLRVK